MKEFMIVLTWIALGIPGAGMYNATFYNEFPDLRGEAWDKQTCSTAYLTAIFGPINTVVTLFMSGFAEYGVKYDCD